MADENTPAPEESGSGNGEVWNKETPTPEKIRIERDRAEKRARELAAKLDEATTKIQEFEAFRAKVEEERAALEEVEARKEKDWGKLEERYKSQLADRDKKLGDKDKEIAELLGWKEGQIKEKREGEFLEKISAKTGLQNKRALRALLREAAGEKGIDIAPESIVDDAVDEAVKAIREMSPELFTSAGAGGSPGVPGSATRTTTTTTNRGEELGRRATQLLNPGRQ